MNSENDNRNSATAVAMPHFGYKKVIVANWRAKVNTIRFSEAVRGLLSSYNGHYGHQKVQKKLFSMQLFAIHDVKHDKGKNCNRAY
jgi:hypothetical protein